MKVRGLIFGKLPSHFSKVAGGTYVRINYDVIFIGQKQKVTTGPLPSLLFHLNFGKLFQQTLKNCLTFPFTTNINCIFYTVTQSYSSERV